MKEIKIEKIDDFKSFVENMALNVRYLLPKNSRYKWIKIEKDIDYFTKDISFSWSMEHNYYVTRRVGYVYPYTTTSNRIKSFKTEKGAKNNLIKNYEEYFLGL